MGGINWAGRLGKGKGHVGRVALLVNGVNHDPRLSREFVLAIRAPQRPRHECPVLRHGSPPSRWLPTRILPSSQLACLRRQLAEVLSRCLPKVTGRIGLAVLHSHCSLAHLVRCYEGQSVKALEKVGVRLITLCQVLYGVPARCGPV